jgi:hypothetical protein
VQSQRFEGPTLAKAKANAVRELTDDRIASIEAIRDLTPAHVAGEGSTQEEALQAAKKRIPSDAIEVEEPRVTKEGDAGVVTVEKEEEMEARNPLRGLSPKGGGTAWGHRMRRGFQEGIPRDREEDGSVENQLDRSLPS